jgi:amidophosphoribosyltransferase
MCAIFGAFDVRKAAELTVIGLHGNQHRAIDYAGIVSAKDSVLFRETGNGLARQVFTFDKMERLHGRVALGHLRYPTVADDPLLDNVQPILGTHGRTPIAIAHNGNLTNVEALTALVPGRERQTSMDTELILRLLEAQPGNDIEEDLVRVLGMLEGSFALGILLPNGLIAARDARGNRPLSIAKLNEGYCISSETCVFPNLGAEYLFDVLPGTFVHIGRSGLVTRRFAAAEERKCRFEAIYYSHPASRVFGENVSRFRMEIGRRLESLFPVPDADLVTPIPDSSNFMAMGYGESGRSGKYFPVITRSHYVGRTFIAATQVKRNAEVAQKFTFSEDEIPGKNIVVLDDSIVRGTTLPNIVRELRRLKAKAVHVRIGSPPITHSCRYGINTPTREELISASLDAEEIRAVIGADSVEFLPLEVLRSLSPDPQAYCYACMDGQYW